MYNIFLWTSVVLLIIWIGLVVYKPQNYFLHPTLQPAVTQWITFGYPIILAVLSVISLTFHKSRGFLLAVFSRIFFLLVLGGVFAAIWFWTPLFDAFK